MPRNSCLFSIHVTRVKIFLTLKNTKRHQVEPTNNIFSKNIPSLKTFGKPFKLLTFEIFSTLRTFQILISCIPFKLANLKILNTSFKNSVSRFKNMTASLCFQFLRNWTNQVIAKLIKLTTAFVQKQAFGPIVFLKSSS